jgi:HEAT repeat protein
VVAAGAIWTIDRTEAVVPTFTELLDSSDERVRRLAAMNLKINTRWRLNRCIKERDP